MSRPQLPNQVIEVADGFWNIRGSFKIARVIDIRTQASLVRRQSGKYVLLDACTLTRATQAWLGELTRNGRDLEAIIHLHPFHTISARAVHELYPDAALYGTARHLETLSDLPWQELRTEGAELHQLFADDFDFSVPRGVDFISADPRLHFSSVLAFHRGTKTLHVDDTLMYVRLPGPFRLFGRDTTRFHPTLPKVLERRAGAAEDFRAWAAELVERARDLDNLCAAHTAVLLGRENIGESIAERTAAALTRVEGKLKAHERQFGE